jgi:hypothetical protein
MDERVFEFYENKKRPVSEILKRGRKQGLRDAQIYEGMQIIYDKIQSGEFIKDIALVWRVWEEAKRSEGREMEGFVRDFSKRKTIIWSLRKELKDSTEKHIDQISDRNAAIKGLFLIIALILSLLLMGNY